MGRNSATRSANCRARQPSSLVDRLAAPAPPSASRERLVYPILMPAFICTACGTQHAPSEAPPDARLICTDERQFVPTSGLSLVLPGGATEWAQQQVRLPRAGAYDDRDHGSLRHWTAGDPCTHAGRQRPVGLCRPDRRRHGRHTEGTGWRRSDRDLPSTLLYHDGRLEPRTRGSAGPPARR